MFFLLVESILLLTIRLATGISNAFPKIDQDIMREHKLINFFLLFVGIIFVIDTIEFKSFRSIDSCCSIRKRYSR